MKDLLLLTNISEMAKELKDAQEGINLIKNILTLLKDSQINFYKNLPELIKECEEDLEIQLDIFNELHEEMLNYILRNTN
jgi:hypothetical protein